jgi:HD-like signal output (HDOD) protein/CheY-like chemotaxis protein
MVHEGSAGDRPSRVLFVDDEPLVVRSLRRTLATRKLGWEPCFTESGTQALALVDEGNIDVIVSDMHMPGMDGATLLRRVQERHPEVVRIILSGQTDPKLVFRAVPVAHQFLTKPFDTTLLVATIERALDLRRIIMNPALRAIIGADNRLPAAPKVYTALTRALSREDASLPQIVELIERDPGLAARVAQLGSSSFFRVPRAVSGLSGIVSYLGVDIIKTLVLTVEIVGVFATKTIIPGFSIDAFQTHSVTVAHIARRMLERGDRAEEAFLAGILHDVGRLVLASRCPALLTKAIATSRETGTPLHAAEKAVLGVTHADIGGYLLGTWGLPLEIVDAVLSHHEAEPKPTANLTLSRAVFIANTLAHDPDADVGAPPAGTPGAQVAPLSAEVARLEQYRRLAREIAFGEAP